MWCRNCNIETNESLCPICGGITEEDIPVTIYWCKNCNIPVIQIMNQTDKGLCPVCGKKTKKLASDLRPVFPEERLLLEILLEKEQNEFLQKSVWANDNRYYIDGEPISLPNELFLTTDADKIAERLDQYKKENTYQYFNLHMDKFIKANQNRLNYLKDEAFEFIRNAASQFPEEKIVISFSGGKDSTVTAEDRKSVV